jgi:hypothetical protein
MLLTMSCFPLVLHSTTGWDPVTGKFQAVSTLACSDLTAYYPQASVRLTLSVSWLSSCYCPEPELANVIYNLMFLRDVLQLHNAVSANLRSAHVTRGSEMSLPQCQPWEFRFVNLEPDELISLLQVRHHGLHIFRINAAAVLASLGLHCNRISFHEMNIALYLKAYRGSRTPPQHRSISKGYDM